MAVGYLFRDRRSRIGAGLSHPLLAPYQAFQTADGWINVGAANQTNWLRLLDVIDAVEWAEDPDFRSNEDRMAHLDRLVDMLAPIFKSRPSADWLASMEAAGIPAGPVLDIAQMHPTRKYWPVIWC